MHKAKFWWIWITLSISIESVLYQLWTAGMLNSFDPKIWCEIEWNLVRIWMKIWCEIELFYSQNLVRNWMKFGAKLNENLVRNWLKFGAKLVEIWWEIDWNLVRNWMKIWCEIEWKFGAKFNEFWCEKFGAKLNFLVQNFMPSVSRNYPEQLHYL